MPDVPERPCKNTDCGKPFKPIREMFGKTPAAFCSTDCRKEYWRKANHLLPHPCPLCTVTHDPTERSVIDALEHLVNEWEGQPLGSVGIAVSIRRFVRRRRAILRGEPVAEKALL